MKGITDESIDVVLLFGGVYEFEDYFTPKYAYREIFRILKRDGLLIHGLNAWQSYLRSITNLQLFHILSRVSLDLPIVIVYGQYDGTIKTSPLRSPRPRSLVHSWRRPIILL